jgi:hypothetical protein
MTPVSSTQISDCPETMPEMAAHCCISTVCIPVALTAPHTSDQPVIRTQIHNRSDRYKHAHMYFPGVDTPPPRALSRA